MAIHLLTYALNVQSDVVGARQRARDIAGMLGFRESDRARISTSVSEIARNSFRYAGGGKVEFELEGECSPQVLTVRVTDEGPGIANLEEILAGAYRSTTGMGIGLIGSRRLMDRFDIHSSQRGTQVTLGKVLPGEAPVISPRTARALLSGLATLPKATSMAEVQTQNAELLTALSELQDKQDRLLELAHELEDTNRGVVALYAELDEKAMHLRHADQVKTRFLSNMSHEFRTPLNSVRALCSMLLACSDGPLQPEQETQIKFIAKASEDLSAMVDDLLDIAKIEAGKIEVRPARFETSELFSALRGMLRPLLVTDTVELVFENPVGVPALFTDESKVSQILRNFVSNAIKFTERGSVTVRARLDERGDNVVFTVSDTGIGIALEDVELIFEEFAQIPNPMQRRVQGTGLGLPLCRRLALLLGGEVSVESTPGKGSTFIACLPIRYAGSGAHLATAGKSERAGAIKSHSVPVIEDGRKASALGADAYFCKPLALIIDDDEAVRYLIRRSVRQPMRFQEARDGASGVAMATRYQPSVIFLDFALPGMRGDEVLDHLRDDPATAHVPVIIVTSHEIDSALRARLLGHARAILPKRGLSVELLASALDAIGPLAPGKT